MKKRVLLLIFLFLSNLVFCFADIKKENKEVKKKLVILEENKEKKVEMEKQNLTIKKLEEENKEQNLIIKNLESEKKALKEYSFKNENEIKKLYKGINYRNYIIIFLTIINIIV